MIATDSDELSATDCKTLLDEYTLEVCLELRLLSNTDEAVSKHSIHMDARGSRKVIMSTFNVDLFMP